MKLICTANTGDGLSPRVLEIGYTKKSIFDVVLGREYVVFALAVYRGVPLALLSDENDLPNWYPIDLFRIVDRQLPPDWLSAAFPQIDDGLQFLVGYEQMITDSSHYDALLEREPSALQVFRGQIVSRRH